MSESSRSQDRRSSNERRRRSGEHEASINSLQQQLKRQTDARREEARRRQDLEARLAYRTHYLPQSARWREHAQDIERKLEQARQQDTNANGQALTRRLDQPRYNRSYRLHLLHLNRANSAGAYASSYTSTESLSSTDSRYVRSHQTPNTSVNNSRKSLLRNDRQDAHPKSNNTHPNNPYLSQTTSSTNRRPEIEPAHVSTRSLQATVESDSEPELEYGGPQKGPPTPPLSNPPSPTAARRASPPRQASAPAEPTRASPPRQPSPPAEPTRASPPRESSPPAEVKQVSPARQPPLSPTEVKRAPLTWLPTPPLSTPSPLSSRHSSLPPSLSRASSLSSPSRSPPRLPPVIITSDHSPPPIRHHHSHSHTHHHHHHSPSSSSSSPSRPSSTSPTSRNRALLPGYKTYRQTIYEAPESPSTRDAQRACHIAAQQILADGNYVKWGPNMLEHVRKAGGRYADWEGEEKENFLYASNKRTSSGANERRYKGEEGNEEEKRGEGKEKKDREKKKKRVVRIKKVDDGRYGGRETEAEEEEEEVEREDRGQRTYTRYYYVG